MADDRLDQLCDDLWVRWTRLASEPRLPRLCTKARPCTPTCLGSISTIGPPEQLPSQAALVPEVSARGREPLVTAFATQMAEFTKRIGEKDDARAGTKMLQAAARILSTDANASYRRAPDFIAYAIDWELEGDDLRKILAACGATRSAIASWDRRGWLGS